MSLSLKLDLKSNNAVLVTNSKTKEQLTTTLELIQSITNDSLLMLVQYKQYELLINAERYWTIIKARKQSTKRNLAIKKQSTITYHQSNKINSLSLKLELKLSNQVLVTNSQTGEQKQVTLNFIQKITRDPLYMLVQYRFYELMINASKHWEAIKLFDAKQDKNEQIYIEQKFRNIMVNDSWINISNYEREMYYKALAWANLYNPNQSNSKVDKNALLAAGSGAATGALISNSIGGIGLAMGGTAIGIGMLGLTTMGTVAGLAAYGISKALN